jgi:prolyl oligopeptidase
VRITEGKNFLYGGEIFNGKIYITSNEDAPRYRMLVVDAASPARANWKEIVPQNDSVLQGAAIVNGLCSRTREERDLALSCLVRQAARRSAASRIGSVHGSVDRKEVFFAFHSFTVPDSIYQVNSPRTAHHFGTKSRLQALIPTSTKSSNFGSNPKTASCVGVRISQEGSGTDARTHPFTGYGGFNVSLTPNFVGDRYLWMERGGVFAVANLRGGAEFGEDWHRARMLEKKQNVFDDFIAAAEYLIAQKYTDKDHLAIRGGSNGGLLMGAMITQRPDLFRAVLCQVPLLDMLRYQNFQIAKLWIPEYGSAEDPKQFDFIYAYSPYHHVKTGAEYPAILFMTADTDTRVDPMHAKKMAALMQAQAKNGSSKERPILLRIESKAGHGQGKPVAKQIEEDTDIYSFLFWQLGVKL